MPFSNEVIGTNGALIRNWMKSENYVAGSSGWQIKKDGTAEFNNGTFRGSIEVGPNPGQHFIVNNSATGDVVDIYDSSNTLVAKIDKFGEIITTSGNDSAMMFGNGYLFVDFAAPPGSYGGMTGFSRSTGSQVVIDSGRKSGGLSSNIFFQDDVNGLGGVPRLLASQRGMSQGSLMQTDSFSNNNSYFHGGSYVATTSDAFGNAAIAHGCSFTPKFCVFSTWDYASTAPLWFVTLWASGMDATNFRVYVRNGSGNPPASGTSFGLQAFFIG